VDMVVAATLEVLDEAGNAEADCERLMRGTKITLRPRRGAESPGNSASFLTSDMREQARVNANAWIKSFRHAPYDGVPMRQRFTYRDESLWWFTEIYLHKMRRSTRPPRSDGARAGLRRGVPCRAGGAHRQRRPFATPRSHSRRGAACPSRSSALRTKMRGWSGGATRLASPRNCPGCAVRCMSARNPPSRRSCTRPSGDLARRRPSDAGELHRRRARRGVRSRG
jgi:hypothetical protein